MLYQTIPNSCSGGYGNALHCHDFTYPYHNHCIPQWLEIELQSESIIIAQTSARIWSWKDVAVLLGRYGLTEHLAGIQKCVLLLNN